MGLVLSREKGQSVHLLVDGKAIIVRVLDFKGGRVQLRFEAGREVVIHRSEILKERGIANGDS